MASGRPQTSPCCWPAQKRMDERQWQWQWHGSNNAIPSFMRWHCHGSHCHPKNLFRHHSLLSIRLLLPQHHGQFIVWVWDESSSPAPAHSKSISTALIWDSGNKLRQFSQGEYFYLSTTKKGGLQMWEMEKTDETCCCCCFGVCWYFCSIFLLQWIESDKNIISSSLSSQFFKTDVDIGKWRWGMRAFLLSCSCSSPSSASGLGRSN